MNLLRTLRQSKIWSQAISLLSTPSDNSAALDRRSALLAGLLAGVGAIGLWGLGLWSPLERMGYNTLFQIREVGLFPHPGWDPRLAVIAIDEASLETYGQFPLSRDRYADLLEVLSFVQPAAIGFDILLIESTPADVRLAELMAETRNVVLAIAGNSQGQAALAPALQQGAEGAYLLGHVTHRVDGDGISRRIALYEGEYLTFSLAMLNMCQVTTLETTVIGAPAEQPDGCDSVQMPTNGEIPRQNLRWINWPGHVSPRPSLEKWWSSWMSWMSHSQVSHAHCHSDSPNSETRRPGAAEIAATAAEDGVLGETPQSSSPALCTYSFADVLDGTVPADVFQNKLVLVGYEAVGIDEVRTPLDFDPPTAGLYLHAAVLDNLLNDRFLRRLPRWLELLLLMGLASGSGLLLNRQTLRARIGVALLLPLLWGMVVFIAFMQQWWLPIAAPVGVFVLAAGCIQLQEERDKQQLMELFAKHVAPETAQLIWQRRGELIAQGKIQPQELTATVLFMDIRNFTGISEQLSSKQLLDWLNAYFEAMTDCIMQHGGVVDKYIGDAIMAVFGVPFPGTDLNPIRQDAIAAVSASIAMHQRLAVLNQELQATHQPLIQFGIGLHTGPVIAGTVGNRQRLNYSIFGDTVNIAARLEARTKTLAPELPYRLMMTEDTYRYIQDRYRGQIVDTVTLRGRQTQTVVYTLPHPPGIGALPPMNSSEAGLEICRNGHDE